MREEPIIFIWKTEGQEYSKKVDRELFYNLMKSIKTTFWDDNEISKKLLRYIPDLETINIDKDRNSQIDIPFIACKMKNKKEDIIVPIRKRHEIIWSILNKYTKDN